MFSGEPKPVNASRPPLVPNKPPMEPIEILAGAAASESANPRPADPLPAAPVMPSGLPFWARDMEAEMKKPCSENQYRERTYSYLPDVVELSSPLSNLDFLKCTHMEVQLGQPGADP